jgi:CHAT domain-containing protein
MDKQAISVIHALAEAKSSQELERFLIEFSFLTEPSTDEEITKALGSFFANNQPGSAAVLLAVRAFLSDSRRYGVSSALLMVSGLPLAQDDTFLLLAQKDRISPEIQIELARRAIHQLRIDSEPGLWAEIHFIWADALGKSQANPVTGDLLLEKAGHYDESVKGWRRVSDFAKITLGLERLDQTWYQYGKSGPDEKIQKAIQACESLLSKNDNPRLFAPRACLFHTLGILLCQLQSGDISVYLERAREYFQKALEIRAAPGYGDLRDWAITRSCLANVYVQRKKGDPDHNQEEAIQAYQEILKKCSGNPETEIKKVCAETYFNLAVAYRHRLRSSSQENIKAALELVHLSLNLYRTLHDVPAVQIAMAHGELATLLSQRGNNASAQDLETAILEYDLAIQGCSQELHPLMWSRFHSNLANVYADRIIGDKVANLRKAIELYQAALQVRTPENYPILWAETQNNLGTVYADLHSTLKHADYVEKARDCYMNALRIRTPQAMPGDCRMTALNLGNLWMLAENWLEASKAFAQAVQADQIVYQNALLRDSKELLIHKTGELYLKTAWVMAKACDYPGALETWEMGRARLLGEKLARHRFDLERLTDLGHSDLLTRYQTANREYERLTPREDSLEGAQIAMNLQQIEQVQEELNQIILEIRKLPGYTGFLSSLNATSIQDMVRDGSAIVYLMPMLAGYLILVVKRHSIVPLWLPSNMREQEDLIQRPWMIANLDQDPPGFSDKAVLEKILSILASEIMTPLAKCLVKEDIQEVVLIPSGRLGLYPLHAARVSSDGTFFSDKFLVRYAPSAQALQSAQSQSVSCQLDQKFLVGAGNPSIAENLNLPSLRFARIELEQIAKLYKNNSAPLYEEAASKTAILGLYPQATHLHFACHGRFNLDHPLESALYLSGDSPLTLREILRNIFHEKTRLVVLSACQTAISDMHTLPEEAIGFPTGFMQAGAPGVVGTLWSVPDFSTALLMINFYKRIAEEFQEPAAALQKAQKWLREMTHIELLNLIHQYQEEYKKTDSTQMWPLDVVERKYIGAAESNPQGTPFSHPYDWAAYVFYGA